MRLVGRFFAAGGMCANITDQQECRLQRKRRESGGDGVNESNWEKQCLIPKIQWFLDVFGILGGGGGGGGRTCGGGVFGYLGG